MQLFLNHNFLFRSCGYIIHRLDNELTFVLGFHIVTILQQRINYIHLILKLHLQLTPLMEKSTMHAF